MVQDWSSLPFVEMTANDEKCAEGWEVLYHIEWKGTVDGCHIHPDIVPISELETECSEENFIAALPAK